MNTNKLNHYNALLIIAGVALIAAAGIQYDLPAVQVIGKAIGAAIVAAGCIFKL